MTDYDRLPDRVFMPLGLCEGFSKMVDGFEIEYVHINTYHALEAENKRLNNLNLQRENNELRRKLREAMKNSD